ncbi:hypothetical protein RHSIM_Rhsim13G0117300 [Rhododendron simsii]|uniref:Uncharacterized protein n=1 Tax=Rhododendron simsii TaxID=118357 RepID=A0A834G1G7_RHOSS|nr:hypothetical protein RHSIM_Rhsim13G0117300 [Rhododendron simsii]
MCPPPSRHETIGVHNLPTFLFAWLIGHVASMGSLHVRDDVLRTVPSYLFHSKAFFYFCPNSWLHLFEIQLCSPSCIHLWKHPRGRMFFPYVPMLCLPAMGCPPLALGVLGRCYFKAIKQSQEKGQGHQAESRERPLALLRPGQTGLAVPQLGRRGLVTVVPLSHLHWKGMTSFCSGIRHPI